MKITFSDGSFMLSWDHACAWYGKDGELVDCEKKLRNGKRRAIPDRNVHERQWLQARGYAEVKFMARCKK